MTDFSTFHYNDTHEFHKLCNKPSFTAEHKMGILHTNICSISKNLKTLQTIISTVDYKFEIIAVRKTWHTTNNDSDVRIIT